MAHQSGTATDPADILDKLRLFALAHGFTVDFWGDRSTGTAPRKALQLSKGVLHGSFLSDSSVGNSDNPGNYVGTYAHDAYSAPGGTENQPNASLKCFSNAMSGPYQAYDFFCDNGGGAEPYLYVVVETGAGTFQHFGIGRLNCIGTITTGVFAYASNWNYDASRISVHTSSYHGWPFDSGADYYAVPYTPTAIRADSDSISPRWFDKKLSGFGSSYGGGVRGNSNGHALVYGPMISSASQLTGRSVLAPCVLAVDRVSGLRSMVGAPPNVRWVMLSYLDPGQTITLGTDTWKVFPVIRKQGSIGLPNSELYGYAYLVN